jgi:two-component system sensor histidine kinase TctE
VAKERLFEQVFPGEKDVQYEAIEVVAYRLRKKLAGTGRDAGHAARPGLPAAGRDVSEPMTTARARRGPRPLGARTVAAALLLMGILLPVGSSSLINTWSLYRQAGPPTPPTTARCWPRPSPSASSWTWTGYDDDGPAAGHVPYSALEAFEADNQSRMYYRISTLAGRAGLGLRRICPVGRAHPGQALRRAGGLLRRHLPRRAGAHGRAAAAGGQAGPAGMAVIQVAETLELRHHAGAADPVDTLWRQALLIGVIALVVVVVVQRATRPVRALSAELQARAEGDLTPIAAPDAPRELLPLVDATNAVMHRLAHCWRTRSALCATPRTSCARRWRC